MGPINNDQVGADDKLCLKIIYKTVQNCVRASVWIWSNTLY